MANPGISGIGYAVGKFFEWLVFENDPDKKAKRAMRKEYAKLKKIVGRVVKVRLWRHDFDLSQNLKQKKILKRKIERSDWDINNLLDIGHINRQ